MADEFKPIETQEQLNAIIGERIKREREQAAGNRAELENKVADYEKQISALTNQAQESAKKYAGYDKALTELQTKVKGYETASVKTRIAHELGLPYEMAERLRGESEADIRTDAEAFQKALGGVNHSAPLRNTEEPGGGGKDAAKKAELKGMLQDLRGE